MKYLLDTDVIIDYFKKDPSILESLIDQTLLISIITSIEIKYGLRKTFHPEKRKTQFADFLNIFSVTILPIDSLIADQFVNLKTDLENKKESLADFDLFIASTALVNDLTLVTRNIKHFIRIKNLKVYT